VCEEEGKIRAEVASCICSQGLTRHVIKGSSLLVSNG